MNTEDFAEWLAGELEIRGWTQADLARKTGITSPQISRVLSRERMPGVEFCVAVAKAFKVSPLVTLKLAGLLEEDVSADDIIDRLTRVLSGWSREERLRFLQLALSQDEMFERAKQAARAARGVADDKTKFETKPKAAKE